MRLKEKRVCEPGTKEATSGTHGQEHNNGRDVNTRGARDHTTRQGARPYAVTRTVLEEHFELLLVRPLGGFWLGLPGGSVQQGHVEP